MATERPFRSGESGESDHLEVKRRINGKGSLGAVVDVVEVGPEIHVVRGREVSRSPGEPGPRLFVFGTVRRDGSYRQRVVPLAPFHSRLKFLLGERVIVDAYVVHKPVHEEVAAMHALHDL